MKSFSCHLDEYRDKKYMDGTIGGHGLEGKGGKRGSAREGSSFQMPRGGTAFYRPGGGGGGLVKKIFFLGVFGPVWLI